MRNENALIVRNCEKEFVSLRSKTNEIIIMCQTALISNNIVRLGTRSYKQRIEAVSDNRYSVNQLARLNRDLDDFYELLYEQWNSVTERDYQIFGPQLQIMLTTLKELYMLCKNMAKGANFEKETEKLGMNYSAIYEVNSDILNFKVNMKKDNEIRELMEHAAAITTKTTNDLF